MKKNSTNTAALAIDGVQQKIAAEIAATQKQVDAAKQVVKAAKADCKRAKKKFKEARRAAKKLKKELKSLEAEFEMRSAKKAPAARPRPARASGRAPVKKSGDAAKPAITLPSVTTGASASSAVAGTVD